MNKQKYILVKGSSGLGNRILAAATAILYGQITQRKVIIDWSDGSYSENGVNVFHIYFQNSSIATLQDLPITDSVYPQIWQGNLHRPFGALKNELQLQGYSDMSFDVKKIYYSEEILVFCSYNSKIHEMRELFINDFTYLKKMTNPEILKIIISQNFKLQFDLRERVEQFKKQHFSNYNIGVHIRYSDMKISLDQLYQQVVKVQQKYKKANIFLATDSQKILQDFQNTYDNVIVTDKWFSPSGQRLHQNWDECPDKIENGRQALLDLYLLAECDSLIFSSQSSFGYVASLLSKSNKLYDLEKPSQMEKIREKISQLGVKFFS
jgi:hypothetical protein